MLKNIIDKIKRRFTKEIEDNRVSLRIAGISYSQIHNVYVLILEEIVPNWDDPHNPPVDARKVPIVINFIEAQSIAVELEQIKTIPPLIFDFITEISKSFNFKFKWVEVSELRNGELFTNICCDNKEQTKIIIKPSESVAIAIRQDTPIYISDELLTKINDILQDKYDIKRVSEGMKEDNLESYDIDQLKIILQESIDREDYEKASQIRDEINRKKVNSKTTD